MKFELIDLPNFPNEAPPKHSEGQVCSCFHNAEPTTKPSDRPITPEIASPQHRDAPSGCDVEKQTAAVASPLIASPPPLFQSSNDPSHALEDREWKIRKIVGNRRMRRGYEYRVRWEDTWLLKSELGNA